MRGKNQSFQTSKQHLQNGSHRKDRNLNHAKGMKIYEGKISYVLVKDGDSVLLDTPSKVMRYMCGAFEENPVQESMWVISLNRKNHALGRTMVSLGVVHGTLVAPREIFRVAILGNASAIILVHNHPSGDPAPSTADIRVTRMMKEASEIMGIELLDHVIIGDPEQHGIRNGYYSFADSGLM